MGLRGGVVDRVIYVASGTEQREGRQMPATDVLCLDTSIPKAEWRHVTDIPGRTVDWRMGTVVGGKLYLFGGLAEVEESQDDADSAERAFYKAAPFAPRAGSFAYDIASKQWKPLERLPTPMGSGGCAVMDEDHIIIAGGLALAMDGSNQPDHRSRLYLSTECLLYDIKKDRYERMTPSMRIAVSDQGCVCLGEKLFVVGGEDSPWKSRTDLVQVGQLP
jgi:N-acetylneuraminic acid mutarotase